MDLFLEGKLETDEQKALREENEKLRAKQAEMLASLGKKQLEVDLLKKSFIWTSNLAVRSKRHA